MSITKFSGDEDEIDEMKCFIISKETQSINKPLMKEDKKLKQ
jgi:hypothetical protein